MSNNVLVELSDALADAAEKAGKATVLVNARRRMPASGIVYAADLILTADHIIEREEGIKVTLADGTEVSARLAGRDPGSDLAVLKLERSVDTVAEATKSPARLGQIALVLGRPSANGIEASLGTVSAIGGPIRTGRGGMRIGSSTGASQPRCAGSRRSVGPCGSTTTTCCWCRR